MDDLKWPAIFGCVVILAFAGSHVAITIWGNPANIEADKTTIGLAVETEPNCEACCKECEF